MGDGWLFFGVDEAEDEAEEFVEEHNEGGCGDATLGGVDRGEDRGEVNMGIPCLKMGAEAAIVRSRLALIMIREWQLCLLFGFGSGWSANGWDISSKLPERLLGGVGV